MCSPSCCCPPKSGTTGSCLDDLIDQQTQQITEADRAKSFKAELEDLLKKAKAAKADYTVTKYQDLRDRWIKQDSATEELIRTVVCAVPCWRCLIECEVCPLLYAIRDAEVRLNGDGTLTKDVYSLRDLRDWQERNRDNRKAVFERIQKVLGAWEKPAQTLEKVLADDQKLIDDIKRNLASDPAGAVYDLFIRLVPMQLAIKPPDLNSKVKTEYTQLCTCDSGTPDVCCGLDVGSRSVWQRSVAPQPYLVDPDKFFEIICCLASERYLPAKDLLAKAEADLAKTEAEIKRLGTDIEAKRTSLAADFKASVANPADCTKYRSKDSDSKPLDSPGKKPADTQPPAAA